MDFNRWMREQDGRHAEPKAPPLEDRLADRDLDLMKDGSVMGRCCCCERRINLTVDWGLTIDECLAEDGSSLHCGGSPRCCP